MCGTLFAFLATLAFTAPPVRAQIFAPAIHVFSCQVSSDTHNALLTVRFRNDSSATLASILWRAKYGSGYIDFPDRGKFSPGATVKRQIPLFWRFLASDPLKHGYQGFPFPENCSIIETKTEDGAEWGTPSTASDSVSIPTVAPDDATPIPATLDNPLRNPVGIISCQYAAGDWAGYLQTGKLRGHAMLYVRFRNLASTSITRVVFRVPYASSGIDFVDGGTFSPGVLVKSDKRPDLEMRKLSRDDLPRLPWAITSLDEAQNCMTVTVQFSDGTSWQNPTIDPMPAPLPTIAPAQ